MAFLLPAAPVLAEAGAAWGASAATATAATAATAAWAAPVAAGAGSGILGTLGTVASIASPAVSGLGMVMSGAEKSAQAKANADLLEYNKAVAEEEAKSISESERIEEMKLDRQKKLMLSAEKAGFSASGFTTSGTPLAIMADTASQYEMDRAIMQANATTEANRRRSQGYIYGLQAGNQRSTASNSLTRGLLTGVSSALDTIGNYSTRSKSGYRYL